MENPKSKIDRPFSWWDKQNWKPTPPAADETPRPGHALPQGEEKWRLNNPKKRATSQRGSRP